MTKKVDVTISVYAQTDVGRVRRNNEDNFLLADLTRASYRTATEAGHLETSASTFEVGEKGFLAAVSDGMGGALAGEVASQLAVDVVRLLMQKFQSLPQYRQLDVSEQFRLAVEQANKLIHAQSQSSPQFAGMGATFTGAAYRNGHVYLAQVGDSRAYIIRDNQIMQVTKDQSLVNQLVDAGFLTEEQAQEHVYKNVILQALGAQPDTVVVLDRLPICRKDVILLCSDGLSNKVPGSDIIDVMTSTRDLEQACQRLIDLANERGGEDNITVVVCQFDGETLPAQGQCPTLDVERIRRDDSLPISLLPGLIDPSALLRQAVEHTDHPPESRDVTADNEAPEPAAEETAPESEETALFQSSEDAEIDAVERHIAPLMITLLIAIILGAALAIAWYLKSRGAQSQPPSDLHLPSLTKYQQVHERVQNWTSLMTQSTGWLAVQQLGRAEV